MTRPISAKDLVHWAARDDFEVFLRLGFVHLNAGQRLEPSWYISAMANQLDRSYRGECLRLIMTLPPRYLKSTIVSVLLPAWAMGRDPGLRIIVASYGQELADALSREFRRVVTSQWYHEVFPDKAARILRDTNTETTMVGGGYRYAATVGGTLTGRGAHYLICDDLTKAIDTASPQARDKLKRFFDETLLSRLDNKATGRVLVVQQRLHEDDIVAHALEKEGYFHLKLPAIAVEDSTFDLTRGRRHHRKIGDALNPEREPREVLDRIRGELGPGVFEAQYQQDPTAPDAGVIRYQDFQFYDFDPSAARWDRILQSWDTAVTEGPSSDYTAGTTWGLHQGIWHLIDAIRFRQDYHGILERTLAWAKKWKADNILIENSGLGSNLLKDVRRANKHAGRRATVILVTARVSKRERLEIAAERLYSGVARLPRTAPFMADVRKELTSFPNGRHDDWCDSLSQALNYINQRRETLSRRPGERPPGSPRRPLGRARRLLEDDLL